MIDRQIQDLASRHGLDWCPAEIQPLMALIGGHPFLVRLAMYRVAHQEITLPDLLRTAPTDSGIYADHLRRLNGILAQQPELATTLREVVTSDRPIQLQTNARYKLQSLGLVKLQENEVTISYQLYRQYFRDR